MPRLTRGINPRLDKKLAVYAAAATAAIGAGSLPLAQPAQAEIVSTKTNMQISFNPIDLNGDGIADVAFVRASEGSYMARLNVDVPTGNAWFGGTGHSAVPTFFGVPVGPGGKFGSRTASTMAVFSFSRYGNSNTNGLWAGKTNRYLGLKFMINGQQHFGWVRITVAHGQGTITGYAYETVPNKPIKAGYTNGPQSKSSATSPTEHAVAPAQATLGMLGRGADALSLWRRSDETPYLRRDEPERAI